MTTRFYIAPPLLALAAAFVAVPLAAEQPTVVTGERQAVYQERVSFADLDLRNGSGQRMLKWRVHRASESVCIQAVGLIEANLPGPSWRGNEPSCTVQTYAAAKPQIAAAIDRAESGRQMALSLTVSRQAQAH